MFKIFLALSNNCATALNILLLLLHDNANKYYRIRFLTNPIVRARFKTRQRLAEKLVLTFAISTTNLKYIIRQLNT